MLSSQEGDNSGTGSLERDRPEADGGMRDALSIFDQVVSFTEWKYHVSSGYR